MDTRKKSILQSIIEEFIDSANPVGSKTLAQFLGFSPATIRSEMAQLEKQGFITQPHTSAGRIPTEKGYRYYLDIIDWAQRINSEKRIKRLTEPQKGIDKLLKLISLEAGGATAFWATPYFSKHFGLSQTLKQKEFEDQQRIVRFAKIIDNLSDFIKSLEFDEILKIKIFIGKENPYKFAKDFSTIVICFPLNSQPCILGVIGPLRMPYKNIIPFLFQSANILSRNQLLQRPVENIYKDIYWGGK